MINLQHFVSVECLAVAHKLSSNIRKTSSLIETILMIFLRSLVLLVSGFIGAFSTITSASAQNSFFDSIGLGVQLSGGFGSTEVTPDPNGEFIDFGGLVGAIKLSAEKPISRYVHINSELTILSLAHLELDSEGASSSGSALSFGFVLGDLNTRMRPYFGASLGYSYADIGDSGRKRDETGDCEGSNSLCNLLSSSFRSGGHSKGLAYKVAVGWAFNRNARLELARASFGGSDSSFPDGADGTIEATYIGLDYRFK